MNVGVSFTLYVGCPDCESWYEFPWDRFDLSTLAESEKAWEGLWDEIDQKGHACGLGPPALIVFVGEMISIEHVPEWEIKIFQVLSDGIGAPRPGLVYHSSRALWD